MPGGAAECSALQKRQRHADPWDVVSRDVPVGAVDTVLSPDHAARDTGPRPDELDGLAGRRRCQRASSADVEYAPAIYPGRYLRPVLPEVVPLAILLERDQSIQGFTQLVPAVVLELDTGSVRVVDEAFELLVLCHCVLSLRQGFGGCRSLNRCCHLPVAPPGVPLRGRSHPAVRGWWRTTRCLPWCGGPRCVRGRRRRAPGGTGFRSPRG